MKITWRVVAIDSTGARIIIDEHLSAERAHEIRGLMMKKGHNTVVEAEVSPQFDGEGDGSPDIVQCSTGDLEFGRTREERRYRNIVTDLLYVLDLP